MTKAERIELEATLATILGISSPDQKFSITIEDLNYKDITMRTHLATVMYIVAMSALKDEPFQVTTEHIIDIDPECPEEDPDDMEEDEDLGPKYFDEELECDLNKMMLRIFQERNRI